MINENRMKALAGIDEDVRDAEAWLNKFHRVMQDFNEAEAEIISALHEESMDIQTKRSQANLVVKPLGAKDKRFLAAMERVRTDRVKLMAALPEYSRSLSEAVKSLK